ncbi:hypothetical protein QQP08_003284 [Theobroma cacao]|nr:hypothetical protein QQP08_003284 [Theobroma cacao]
MVDSSYACPSWVASNGGSTLGDLWMWTSLLLRCLDLSGGLPNCGIESIVCLGKGKHERFYMGCAVENYTVRKTLVQQSCGMECWSLVLSMGRVQWLSELLVVGWVSLLDITIVFWFKHVVFVDMVHKQVAFGKEQSKNGARCDMVIWQGEFRLRLKLGSFSWSMVTPWWMAGIEEFLSRRDWLKKMQAKPPSKKWETHRNPKRVIRDKRLIVSGFWGELDHCNLRSLIVNFFFVVPMDIRKRHIGDTRLSVGPKGVLAAKDEYRSRHTLDLVARRHVVIECRLKGALVAERNGMAYSHMGVAHNSQDSDEEFKMKSINNA